MATKQYKPRNFFGDEVETRKQKKTTIKDSFMWLIFIWELLFSQDKKKKTLKQRAGTQDIVIIAVIITAIVILI